MAEKQELHFDYDQSLNTATPLLNRTFDLCGYLAILYWYILVMEILFMYLMH
jgi:hypothetical protein